MERTGGRKLNFACGKAKFASQAKFIGKPMSEIFGLCPQAVRCAGTVSVKEADEHGAVDLRDGYLIDSIDDKE